MESFMDEGVFDQNLKGLVVPVQVKKQGDSKGILVRENSVSKF